jgi:hypothetical protein
MTITFGKSKVNTVNKVTRPATSISNKIGWLDITMDQVAGMHQFDPLQHLVSNHEHCLERKAPTTLIELILKRWSQQVHYHEIV